MTTLSSADIHEMARQEFRKALEKRRGDLDKLVRNDRRTPVELVRNQPSAGPTFQPEPMSIPTLNYDSGEIDYGTDKEKETPGTPYLMPTINWIDD